MAESPNQKMLAESRSSRAITLSRFGYALLAVGAIILVEYIRPDKDNAVLEAVILSAIASYSKQQETHNLVNSAMTARIEEKDATLKVTQDAAQASTLAAHAIGKAEGIAEQQERDRGNS